MKVLITVLDIVKKWELFCENNAECLFDTMKGYRLPIFQE